MKYHNKTIKIDNITFDSQVEGRRYLELKMLLKAKKISNLQMQPRFELQEKFTDNKGVNHRAITYVADFSYTDKTGTPIVEDVKGMQTAVYKLKKKLFLYIYDAYDFREII